MAVFIRYTTTGQFPEKNIQLVTVRMKLSLNGVLQYSVKEGHL